MIKIQDVEISDLLPYTFKTPHYKALSVAIQKLTAKFYEMMSAVLFWADIENANENLLDAMAAELDCPFYSTDMSADRKRSVIAAAFEYNSRIGTVGAVQAVLTAAFGGGEVTEWFEYDGEPYHFKLRLPVEFGNKYISESIIKNFYKILGKTKNKRSKLDEFAIEVCINNRFNIRGAIDVVRYRTIIPPNKKLQEDRL